MGWNNNKRLKRRREVLHNTRIREEGSYGHSGYSHRYFHPCLLRAVITATTYFWPKSGSRIPKLIFCKKKQQITRDGIIFKVMIVNDVIIFRPVTAPPWLCNLRAGNVLLREHFGAKTFDYIYIPVRRLLGFQSILF